MNRHYNSDDLEELLWQAEAPAEESPEEVYSDEFLLDDYIPQDFEDDMPVSLDEYELPPLEYTPVPREEPPVPQPRQDVRRRAVMSDDDLYADPAPAKAPRKKRRGCGCGCLTILLIPVLLAAAIMLAVNHFIRPPQSVDTLGTRKNDTATILICGTDADGTRTDTMMLLYLSGSENQVRLLSLPRDTYTITASGSAAKLNSAYGRNGTGAVGMEVLLDYVKNIIGYRPDGYILVDFTIVPQIVDIMGGVDVEVPMDMEVDGMELKAGFQHLTGNQVLTLLRYRAGYATADLARIEVQRNVLKACMEQWLSVDHVSGAMDAIELLESGSLSSLSTENYIWVAKTLLFSLKNFGNDTLPGYADYRDGVSYYILDRSKVADMINECYNPYQVTILPEYLKIAE